MMQGSSNVIWAAKTRAESEADFLSILENLASKIFSLENPIYGGWGYAIAWYVYQRANQIDSCEIHD